MFVHRVFIKPSASPSSSSSAVVCNMSYAVFQGVVGARHPFSIHLGCWEALNSGLLSTDASLLMVTLQK